MINMLMRFYDIDSGKITVDGQSVSQLNRLSLRRAYSMVLQDTWLFYGSIFENIAYGKPEASKEEVEAVARAVKLHSYIMRLPEGYDTILTDDGSNISKGQMQLLTIARAMLMDSHMLILDEATSNVDTRTEVQIQLAMRRLMQDKTCFVVAHRLSTVRNADKILVVRNGNVVESGTHDELMTHNGFYRELYYAQFA
jgi:ABC-type multidrug transport system, ATPase and permease components